jgi:biopolymer transport protein ExbD
VSLSLGRARRSRRPSLTPMIDVVFLLLVFFMLASRFGNEEAIKVAGGQAGTGSYEGPPRLVDVMPEGVLLNGSDIREPTLADQLRTLMSDDDDTIVVRARGGAQVQRLVTVMETLGDSGFSSLVLVE